MACFPPEMILDMGLKNGPYKDRVSLQALKENPHGIDLGPHQSQLPERLVHDDKMIRCAPALVLEDLPRLLQQPASSAEAFHLIGRRHVRSNNSWMHNYQRLVKGKGRCQLLMHPKDAERLGLTPGQTVAVRSRVGKVDAELEISDEMMPGVVSLPHGWGHGRKGTQSAVANEHAGVSVNDLTDDQFLDDLSGNAALNGVRVEIAAA